MNRFSEMIKIAVGGIITAASGFLGGFDGNMYALIICISADYITGVAAAVKQKKLSSEVGFWGIFKKMLILVLVGTANMIDTKIIGSGNTFRTAAALYYIGNEGISMLENVAVFGLSLPQKLTDVLEQLKDENGGKDEK